MVFIIEGLLYAVFPDQIRKVMALVLALPEKQIRHFGVALTLCGFLTLWLIASFLG